MEIFLAKSKMKNVCVLVLFIVFAIVALGQSEGFDTNLLQWYVFFKGGVKHNFSTYQDESGNTERTLKTPVGFYNLAATKPLDVEINPNNNLKFETFSFAFPAGINGDSHVFLDTGIEYQPMRFQSVH